MNRFLLGAVALTSLVGVSAALPSGGSEEWVALDREIEALSSTLQGDPDKPQGMQVGGYIKTQYNYSADNPAVTGDESGFGFNSIRINITGQVGDYKIKVSAEGKSGTFGVADAYVRFPVHENVNVQVGQFKSRFLYSYYTSDQNTLFYDRAAIPSAWGQRDTGVQVDGTFGPFIGILQVQNGGDTVGDEYAITAKAIYAVMGKAIEGQAGGFGPDAETALTLGVGYLDDGSVTDGDAIEGEAIFTHGPWYAAAEVVDHGTGFTNGGAPTQSGVS